MVSPGIRVTSRSTSVVLPAPDGAETTNSRPRLTGGASPTGRARSAPTGRWGASSFDILYLLAHLLELRLRRDNQLGHAQAVGLRAHGVDLAVHFLQQKIELATARLGAVGERLPV